MKWGDFRIANWDSLLKALLVIIAVIIIIGILVDFVSWRDALNFVKQKIPISGTAYKWIKGYGYVPLVWRGRFDYIWFVRYKNPTREDLTDYISIEFAGHHSFRVYLGHLGDSKIGYGSWSATQAAIDYIEEKREGWEQIAQPFGTYCEVYVEVHDDKLFVYVMGEDRIFIRQFKCRIGGGNCGGGYVTLYWP